MSNVQQQILDVIYNCGGITKKGVEIIAGDNLILKEFLDKKIIKKQPIQIKDKRIALYTITETGEKYYTEKTGKKYFFRCNRLEKIVALSYFYISEIENCNTWKNKDEWYSVGEIGFIPDGTYQKDGKKYGIVIIRNNEKDRIEQKLEKFIKEQDISQINIVVQEHFKTKK